MVRFKVVRASRLLLAAAVILLAVALALLGARLLRREPAPTVSGSANLVDAANTDEAKTTLVFASSGVSTGLPLDPGGEEIEVEVLAQSTEAPAPLRVLIYHTHTHEAYEQVSEDPYDALEAWRTSDADHSVVRVGEELAKMLANYGFEVVHDTTDHEGDELSTAYTRSLKTLENYDERFDLYVDLHRDAFVEGERETVAGSDGEALAPLMLLIGNGNGFDVKPYYEQNYAFARALEERINAIEPNLCRPTLVKDGRYNQHIGVFAILVEVGHNRNTLRQALNAVPPLAEAIRDLMITRPDAQLQTMQADYIASISDG
ncbi:MAG: stage II sporulation protein P [Clostridia bacterium]|nr:stage II sporulation protein P [Clostridia bacterium]